MEQNIGHFQPKLPTRVAGLVFWVLVLVSLIVAIFYLNKVEAELEIERESAKDKLASNIV